MPIYDKLMDETIVDILFQKSENITECTMGFNQLLKKSYCVLSDSGTAAEEGLYYKVPNVSLRMATERMETIESGATIVSGMTSENIVESIVTAVSQPWGARYDFADNFSPSSVVVNAIRTQLTNFF